MINFHSMQEDEFVINLIAEEQGEIYQTAYEMEFDLEDFSEKYLRSEFCHNEMDSVNSFIQTDFSNLCMENVLKEFRQKNIEVHNQEPYVILYSPTWIGMMYRYLSFSLKIDSFELSKIVPFDELAMSSVKLRNCEMQEAVQMLSKKYKSRIKDKATKLQ